MRNYMNGPFNYDQMNRRPYFGQQMGNDYDNYRRQFGGEFGGRSMNYGEPQNYNMNMRFNPRGGPNDQNRHFKKMEVMNVENMNINDN